MGPPALVTPPEWVLSLPWLCEQGKQSTSWLHLRTHISTAAGAMGSRQSLWTSGQEPCPCRAQSVARIPPRLEKSSPTTAVTAPTGSASGCGWASVLGHKLDKGTEADGAGNSVGSACSPQKLLGLRASPPYPQMHRHGCRAAWQVMNLALA